MLPEMTVEKREPKSPHRVPEPDLSPENLSAQMQDAIQLNEDAKLYEIRASHYRDVDIKLHAKAWTQETLDILVKHISRYDGLVSDYDVMGASHDALNCSSFDQVARLVQDDQCSEVFNRMLTYCQREGQKHKNDRGFIDGSGIGYLNVFTRNLKANIEKSFDAKYFYKVARPLEHAITEYNGMNLIKVANKVHPGHWSYPQGHSTKSFTAVQSLEEVFHLDNNCRRMLFIAACVFGHGRDGNLIHFPMDTYGAGYNTKLKEFA